MVAQIVKITVGGQPRVVRLGVAAPATPQPLAGALLDLDADTITAGTTSISTWTDSSGAARNFVLDATGNRPTLVAGAVGGHAAVHFQNQVLKCLSTGITGQKAFTLCAVMTVTGAADAGILAGVPSGGTSDYSMTDGSWNLRSLGFGTTAWGNLGASGSIAGTASSGAWSGGGSLKASSTPFNQWVVVTVQAGVDGVGPKMWINGVAETPAPTGRSLAGDVGLQTLILGSRYLSGAVSGDNAVMSVARMRLHPGRLSATDRAAEENYLGSRYGITVAGAPVSAPTALTLTATPGNGQVTISASGGTGATSYALYRSATVTGSPIATSFPFTDTGRTNGTAYTYIATATNSGGTVTSAPVTATPAVTLLWTADYDSLPAGDTVTPVWVSEEEPHSPGWAGAPQTSRISIVGPSSVPGAGTYKPAGNAMRVELRPYETSPGAADGDVWIDGPVNGGYYTNRAETIGRIPPSYSDPNDQWPDPVGSTRWYGWSLLVPTGFQFTPNADPWFVLTQWKGRDGGSPPVAIEIKRSGLRFGGVRTNQGLIANDGNMGAISTGTWTRLVVGMKLSTGSDGWVRAFRDGVEVVPQTSVATVDVVNGQPDPIYLKQGIYRPPEWATTHVLYFGPVKIGTTQASVT